MKKLSRIPEALVEDLEALYPPEDLNPDSHIERMIWYGGCRHVVKLLREHHTRQQLNILHEEDLINV